MDSVFGRGHITGSVFTGYGGAFTLSKLIMTEKKIRIETPISKFISNLLDRNVI